MLVNQMYDCASALPKPKGFVELRYMAHAGLTTQLLNRLGGLLTLSPFDGLGDRCQNQVTPYGLAVASAFFLAFDGGVMQKLSVRTQAATLRFVEHFCFPIVREDAKPKPLLGTASILHVNSRRYLIIAAHVIKYLKADPNNFGVPLGTKKAKVWCLGNMSYGIPPSDQKFDVGLARVDEPTASMRLKRSCWREVAIKHLGRIGPYHDTFVFVGYPGQLSDATFGEIRSGRLLAISPIYRGRSIQEINSRLEPSDVPVDERIDLLLEYPKSFLNTDGQVLGPTRLDLRGISGSPVWAVLRDPSLSPFRRLRLVGIVTGGLLS